MINRPFKYQFFVSYTNRDDEVKTIKPFVDDFGRRLEQRLGYSPIFIDSWVLKQQHFDDSELERGLKEGIEGSPFTVCFISLSYAVSEWCNMEYFYSEQVSLLRLPPAPEKSILPIFWKDVGFGADLYNSLMKRLNPLHRSRAIVDIRRLLAQGERDSALQNCVDKTIEYMNAWQVLNPKDLSDKGS